MTTQKSILLVLDLDETLIHATRENLATTADFEVGPFFVHKRPGLNQFLLRASAYFDLAIWSAASDDYVNEIADKIKPEGLDWTFVWGRNRCTTKRNLLLDEYVHEKRLKKVKKLGYSLERILIVDDSPEKTRENYGNAIYIKAFEGDQKDAQLAILLQYLIRIRETNNVRTLEKRGWNRS